MSINTVEIEKALEQLALNEKSRFNAYYISHLSNQTNIDMVNDYLLMKAKFGALIVKVETICPHNHIDQQFEFGVELPSEELECRFCEDEEAMYVPDPENTNVVYYFSSNYIEEVKKKRMKSMQAMAI